MPSNLSENKVNVVKTVGTGSLLGRIEPIVNMVTDQGTIVGLDSGNFQVSVSGNGVGLPTKFYPKDLFVTLDHATGTWSYPTGDGSLAFSRQTFTQVNGTGVYAATAYGYTTGSRG